MSVECMGFTCSSGSLERKASLVLLQVWRWVELIDVESAPHSLFVFMRCL